MKTTVFETAKGGLEAVTTEQKEGGFVNHTLTLETAKRSGQSGWTVEGSNVAIVPAFLFSLDHARAWLKIEASCADRFRRMNAEAILERLK